MSKKIRGASVMGLLMSAAAVLAGVAPAAAAPPSTPPVPPVPPIPAFPAFPAFPAVPTFPSFPTLGPPTAAPFADVSVSNGTLRITGGAGNDLVSVSPADIVTTPGSTVRGGTTSVFLDLPLIQQAAGLSLTGADVPGRPASTDFLVGFPILPSSDFSYVPSPFAPQGGTIRHSGTITFNNSITVGNFDIGFDAKRVGNGRSGFFVASTTGLTGVLFDVAPPSSATAALNRLAVGRSGLLVSAEFAAILGNPALAGAQVGAARIDALSTPSAGRSLTVVVSQLFSVATPKIVTIPAQQLRNVVIDAGSGQNSVTVSRLDRGGDLTIVTGSGNDSILVGEDALGALTIDSGAGADQLSISSSVAVTTSVRTGDGNDSLLLTNSLFTGSRSFDGGAGTFDSVPRFRTDVTNNAIVNFENVR